MTNMTLVYLNEFPIRVFVSPATLSTPVYCPFIFFFMQKLITETMFTYRGDLKPLNISITTRTTQRTSF